MSIYKYAGPPWRNWLARSAGGDYFGFGIKITTFTAYLVSLKVKLIFGR
jgi:hypothetical protein